MGGAEAPTRPDLTEATVYLHVGGPITGLNALQGFDVSVCCPANSAVVSGGFDGYHVSVGGSFPSGNGWRVTGAADAAIGPQIQPIVICATTVVKTVGS